MSTSSPATAAILSAFGRAVRAHRLKLALSQEELAERAGIHRTYIGDVERGRRNIGLVNAARIADALGTSLADLVSEMPRTRL